MKQKTVNKKMNAFLAQCQSMFKLTDIELYLFKMGHMNPAYSYFIALIYSVFNLLLC